MVLLIKTNHSPRALLLACTKCRRIPLPVGSCDSSDSSDVWCPFLCQWPLSQRRGDAAACHKCHSEGRRGFGEDSGWTRVGGQQQQIVNVPAVQLEWMFSVFDVLVPYPIPVILKKLQTQERFLFLLSLPKRDSFNIFPLHRDWGICTVRWAHARYQG